jgi:hypothetical protein
MECDLFYEEMEGFFPPQNVEDDCVDQLSKILSQAQICNQQDKPSGHFDRTVWVI